MLTGNSIQQRGDRSPLLPHNQAENGPPSLRSSCNYKGLFGLLLTATGGLLTVGMVKRDSSSGYYLLAGAGVSAVCSIWYYFQGSPPPASMSIVTDTEYGAIGERTIELRNTQRRQGAFEVALNHVDRFFSDETPIPPVEGLRDYPLWEKIRNLSQTSARNRSELEGQLEQAQQALQARLEGKRNPGGDAAEKAVARALDAAITQANSRTRLSTDFMKQQNLGDLPQVPFDAARILPKSTLSQTLTTKWELMNTALVTERHTAEALTKAQHRKNMTEHETQFKREVARVKQEHERAFKDALTGFNTQISQIATILGLTPQTPPRTTSTLPTMLQGVQASLRTLTDRARTKLSTFNEGKDARSQQRARIQSLEEEARNSAAQIEDLTRRLGASDQALREARRAAIQKSPDKSAAQAAQRTINSLERNEATLKTQLRKALKEKQETEAALVGLRTELRTATTMLQSRSPGGPPSEYIQQLRQISEYIYQAERNISEGYQLPDPLKPSVFSETLRSLVENANAIAAYADGLKYPPQQTTPDQSPIRGRHRPPSRSFDSNRSYTPSPTRSPTRLERKKRTAERPDPTTPYTPDTSSGGGAYSSNSARPIPMGKRLGQIGGRFSPPTESDDDHALQTRPKPRPAGRKK